ncbi:hypothetical protein GF312_15725 [Candidatus Poribacteria bacterium]|nr:hypothetical protein [Candidatus Poribacteria bacterium]
MINVFINPYGRILIYLCLIILFGCSSSKKTDIYTPDETAQKLYLKSQQELAKGEYRRAYMDYKSALTEDPGIANTSHLSSIIYEWVIRKSEGEDVILLKAQKNVWLKPEQLELRKQLLSTAVRDNIINVFGLGMSSDEFVNSRQRRLSARKSALMDCQAWTARLSSWIEDGVNGSFNAKSSSGKIKVVKEFWVDDTIYVIKAKASSEDLE